MVFVTKFIRRVKCLFGYHEDSLIHLGETYTQKGAREKSIMGGVKFFSVEIATINIVPGSEWIKHPWFRRKDYDH